MIYFLYESHLASRELFDNNVILSQGISRSTRSQLGLEKQDAAEL